MKSLKTVWDYFKRIRLGGQSGNGQIMKFLLQGAVYEK